MQKDLEKNKSVCPKSKYELTLCEFPIFLLSKKIPYGIKSIDYEDTIVDQNGKTIRREWKVFPDAELGFGTSSTLLTFFDLMQIWAESNFNHQYIEFGSVYNLLKRRGNNFGKNHYAQIINDLYCLLGIKFTAKNAYWDNELKGYVDIILFRLFDHLDIIKCDCKNKNVSLFARIKVSDFLYNSIQKNSLLTVDFNSDFFHSLTPMGQRFALYLSKVFRTQPIHRRELSEFARQIPIIAKKRKHIKETIRQTCDNLIKNGFQLLSDYNFILSADRQTELIVFHRAGSPVVNKFNVHSKKQKFKKEQFRIDCLTEDILDICQDHKSKNFYQKVADLMPDEDIYQAISEVKEIRDSGHVKKSLGAVFTSRILKFAEQRGIVLR